jgi:hypothetical protein
VAADIVYGKYLIAHTGNADGFTVLLNTYRLACLKG